MHVNFLRARGPLFCRSVRGGVRLRRLAAIAAIAALAALAALLSGMLGCASTPPTEGAFGPTPFQLSGQIRVAHNYARAMFSFKAIVTPTWRWLHVATPEGVPLYVVEWGDMFDAAARPAEIVDVQSARRMRAGRVRLMGRHFDIWPLQYLLAFDPGRQANLRLLRSQGIVTTWDRYEAPLFRQWRYRARGGELVFSISEGDSLSPEDAARMYHNYQKRKYGLSAHFDACETIDLDAASGGIDGAIACE